MKNNVIQTKSANMIGTENSDKETISKPLQAILEIKVKEAQYHEFMDSIQLEQNIEFCYRVTGKTDFIAKIIMADLKELEEFIDNYGSVAQIISNLIIFKANTNYDLAEK
ncbi:MULTISPECIES: Lrp/AsnC family transcriptional regulator [Bacillus]|uniref:Lrp/AsnC family transcriptional regulator n=1 Tax=Bacillus TaxID=1386 RepID=UPI000BEDF227|nr:Lrp/AsnC ligand binding domain-containing protein [Bacillus pseudomycoides]PEE38340.1 transcriptional regulator [Bacillus pseudomycoides]PEI84473.1 transcriptional regulator [Bacillus pseudomycoides]PGA85964.1 transcriptional regulator [Bacillus pseudomycoides]PHF44358.1 transcriptional regulator [Bacillus pseudomycoides]